MSNKQFLTNFIGSLPVLGIIVFVALYIFSSTLYPGGSQADLNSEGFDWINNYWCNLMNEKGMNGLVNPSRPFSISAMIILCLSLMLFFIRFAQAYPTNKLWKQLIRINGVLSMTFALLIFTSYHDLMTIISSFFGLFVVIGIIREVYRSQLFLYKFSGIICLLLLGINNYIYYTQHLIETLPLLQKITFLIILTWIVGLNFELNRKKRKLISN